MHCQICFHDAPGHYDDCPVATGEAVAPESPQDALTRALARLQRHLDRGSEPYWMQDVRLAVRRLEATRAALRPDADSAPAEPE